MDQGGPLGKKPEKYRVKHQGTCSVRAGEIPGGKGECSAVVPPHKKKKKGHCWKNATATSRTRKRKPGGGAGGGVCHLEGRFPGRSLSIFITTIWGEINQGSTVAKSGVSKRGVSGESLQGLQKAAPPASGKEKTKRRPRSM